MENIPVTIKMISEEFRNGLEGIYPREEINGFLYILCREWLGLTRLNVHMETGRLLSDSETEQFRDALSQLREHRPIQYITGSTEFHNVKILVREGVLIPRPETEELVALILRDHQNREHEKISLLDIGTGSGCIPVAIKKKMPLFDVTGIDISPEALQIASENAILNNTEIRFIKADILESDAWKEFPGYSVIISNPPYIPEGEHRSMNPNVVEFEPHPALFVPDDDPLRFYDAISRFAFLHLIRPGLLYFEINEKFGKPVKDLVLKSGFERAELIRDINGKDRFIRAEAKSTMMDTSY